MARLNKFASVNLNDSYGKPDRGGSANSSNNGNTPGSGKPRISSPGGMLVLSRPGRTQPPSPKPGQARLGIPSPINLPSLKRETSSGDTLAASPPIAGWSKGESPSLTGWSKGESPTEASPLNQKVGLSRSLDTVGESLQAMSTGKPDVYAPPAMRAAMQAGSTARALPPTPPQPEKLSGIIRGEEFPTLQAALARPPTPPQHSKQKDLQQKQREKQQEAKELQLKLHQLSEAQEHKQIQAGFSQSSDGSPQSHPPTLSLRPLGKPEGAYQRSSVEASSLDPSLHSHFGGQGTNPNSDVSLSLSPPAGLSSQSGVNKGSSAFADRSLSRSPPLGIPSQGTPSRVDDARESGHNLRPQYKSHLPTSQSSPSVEVRQPGFQANLEPSWLSSSRRDLVTSPREIDHFKPAGDARTSIGEDMGRTVSEMRSAIYARESCINKDSSSHREGNNVSGYVREDKYMEQGGFTKENFENRNFGRSSSLIHDGVPRIEGFHSQCSSVREVHNREPREGNHRESREVHNRESREGNTRVIREPGLRYNVDSYNREKSNRSSGDIYDRDVKEAYSRDSRTVYSRDVREVSQDSPTSKQVGYGYASNNNGDISWRGHAEGRVPVSPVGISPAHNPGSGYDAYYGKRYGSQGMGDQSSTRDARVGIDPRAPRGQHIEPAGAYSSTSEIIGSRRVRSPVLNNSSFDSVKEVHEVCSDRSLYAEDRQARYEDKVMDFKGAGNESNGSSFNAQRPVSRRDSTQGFGTRTFQASMNKKPEDDRFSREDVRKQLALEDERRKEAARLKLMELEKRIARRAVEGRKEELEVKGKEFSVEADSLKQQDVEQAPGDAHLDPRDVAPIHDRDNDILWGEEDSGSRLARPSSASSASSWAYRSPGEGATSHQDLDSRLVGESELSQQDKKVVRSRSPGSWRKEIGGGPTSKLFSSPYIESGGLRRPSDGGVYKLF